MESKNIIFTLSVLLFAFGNLEAISHCEIFASATFDYSEAKLLSSYQDAPENISPMPCCTSCSSTAGCNSFSYEVFPSYQTCSLYTLSSNDRSSLQVNVSPNYIGFPW